MVGRAASSGLRTSPSAALELPARALDVAPRSNATTQSNRSGCSNVLARTGQASRKVSRYRGQRVCRLVASLLARANRCCTAGSPFWIARPRGFATAGARQYHAQACSLGVPKRQADLTEPPLALGRGQAHAPNPLPARQVSARFSPRPRQTRQVGVASVLCANPFAPAACAAGRSFSPATPTRRDCQPDSGAPLEHRRRSRGFARP